MPLVLAGIPIGRTADATPQLRLELGAAQLIAAEDTRRLHRLCADLDIAPAGRVLSYFEGNEARRAPELLAALRAGQRVLLVTDAGMPTVSDPGFRLVAAAAAEDLPVTCVPGPSAVTAALAVSGLPSDRFCFEGFLPRRPGERRTRLGALGAERRTLVFFEAPHRLAATLADLAVSFGADRRAVVCRELTKTHEEVRRGALAELAAWAAAGARGEITLVVAGAPERAVELTADELVGEVRRREAAGLSRKEAIAAVGQELGLPRRSVYDAVIRSRSGASAGGGAAPGPEADH